MEKIRKIKKFINRETILYLIVGVLTTAVDYAVFIFVNETMKRGDFHYEMTITLATVISWVVAVLFAYIANKLIVFGNFNFKLTHVIKEMTSFFGARIISGGIVMVLMWILTGVFGINEYIAKIGTSVFNIVFNYAASKLFIFK